MTKKSFWEKVKEIFKSDEAKIQSVIDNPVLLNKIYCKVLELQSQANPKFYIG